MGITGLVYLKLKTLVSQAIGVSFERRGALSVGDMSGCGLRSVPEITSFFVSQESR